MARRKKHDEHANHEAWAIPYGDLVTLLMAFFVVMYAVSVVDAGKYRVLSNSLIEAFGSAVPVEPIQIGEPSLALNLMSDDVHRSLAAIEIQSGGASTGDEQDRPVEPLSPTDVAMESVLDAATDENRDHILREIQEMSEEVEAAMEPLIENGDIQVNRKPYWLEININTKLLFFSGSATLEAAARPALADVARILSKRKVRIHVEGHTDNLPISNTIYPSNWELSSGRAATVVNLFAQYGIDPGHMVAIGYGEFQPLASNATEAGRAQNRRVEVIVLPQVTAARAGADDAPEPLKADYEAGLGQL
ncbi:flagellar motor protein MotD [Thiorhodococcus mannitoliphagus]|uniref:Flagellar motor protein MotD n=1 Tax=Thiorhodococcus mannitoliphagus TaxID=329406 RepID=A0A6P1DQ42_9GAMM|nr:flagellar motor protein MotD [Thiorhodococcus mannitoliphagus]NEX20138.1 flagellar motor protein MotD [Thiorhodococcus mannitoliphagus]